MQTPESSAHFPNPPREPEAALESIRNARSQTEDSLHRSEDLFHSLVDSVQDYAIFVLDCEGRVRTWNSGAQRINGYRAEEIIGTHFSAFYPVAAVERGWPEYELRMALADGRFEDEGWRLRKDGTPFWANVIITPLRDETGAHIGFSKVTRDLTERRQYEEALRASEERFRLLVERVGDYAIYMLDAHGRVASWNAGAQRIKGYLADEIIGRHFSCFYTPEDQAQNRPKENLRRAFEEGRYEEERERVRKDGSRFIADVVITPVYDDGGKLRGFAKVTRDVTDQIQAEKALRQAHEELGKRSRQLQRLAVEQSTAEQRERQRIATTLHDHLQQILVAAKFGIGQIRGRTAAAGLNSAVQNVDHLLDEAIQASRDLTVELNPPVLYERGLAAALEWQQRFFRDKHGLITTLSLDREAEPADPNVRSYLFQAVRELLFNVVKHAGTGVASVTLRRKDDMVEITVADEGAGATKAQIPSLLDREESFGLFSIQQRVGLLGGRFRIETAPGQGFRVMLSAPLEMPEPQDEPESQSPHEDPHQLPAHPFSQPRRIRVLIADDHRIVREGIAGLLQAHADIEIVGQAENGRAAVELARQLHPDVVIMDVSMPIMDGRDAARAIRRELPSLKIVALSMHEEEDMAASMLDAGASVYLTKGGPPEALLDALRS